MTEWVAVPKEATKEMIKAGETWSGLPSATWSDMINAAPASDEDQSASFIQEAYNQGLRDKETIQWKTIDTCPYRRQVVIGCWNIDCWLYMTVGHRRDDHFLDEQWRRLDTATHWHDLASEPPKP